MELFNNNSERVPYDRPELPIYIRHGALSNFPGNNMPTHWHLDMEFIVPLTEKMHYVVNGIVYPLEPGMGIWVNSRQLHNGFSQGRGICDYICVLLHPIILCANDMIEQTYLNPVMNNFQVPCAVLSPDSPWQKEVLDAIEQIYACGKKPHADLTVLSQFHRIWALLYDNLPNLGEQRAQEPGNLSALKNMVGYIQRHYGEKITLSKISAAGQVCKSNCCTIFRNYLHRTPIGYLTEYRIGKSLELLRFSNSSITETAYAVGFSCASCYCESFRKSVGKTPTEIRRQSQNN